MRSDGPSLTARGVAAQRLLLDRPASRTGDPRADERLAQNLAAGLVPGRSDFGSWVAQRTRFIDAELTAALAAPIRQVVIAGAGYDGRALRFRTPGVRFFELDHPLTQADKRNRLAAVGAAVDDVVFASADFILDDVAGALETAGHDATAPTFFVCEGVLRYLPEPAFRGLLRALAQRAAPGSVLTTTISTRDAGDESDTAAHARLAHEDRLAAAGEPVLTVPPRAVALDWLRDAGWISAVVHDLGDLSPGEVRGRLLVRATR